MAAGQAAISLLPPGAGRPFLLGQPQRPAAIRCRRRSRLRRYGTRSCCGAARTATLSAICATASPSVFRTRSLQTPDLFRAEFANGKLSLAQRAAEPVRCRLVAHVQYSAGALQPRYREVYDRRDVSEAHRWRAPRRSVIVPPGKSARSVARGGDEARTVRRQADVCRHAGGELERHVNFEVRPLVPLRVRIVDETGRRRSPASI